MLERAMNLIKLALKDHGLYLWISLSFAYLELALYLDRTFCLSNCLLWINDDLCLRGRSYYLR